MKKTLYLIIGAIMTFFLISLSIAAVLIFWSNKGLDNELPLLLLLLAMIAAIGLPLILARRSQHSLDLQRSKRSESTAYATIAARTQGHFKLQANPEIAKELKIPRIGVQLTEKVYVPLVKSFMPAKMFELASYTCSVFTTAKLLIANINTCTSYLPMALQMDSLYLALPYRLPQTTSSRDIKNKEKICRAHILWECFPVTERCGILTLVCPTNGPTSISSSRKPYHWLKSI